MKQMLSKCILLDFPTDFLPQKPYLCTEISKCAEIANRRTSAKNHPLTVRTLPAPPFKGGNFSLPLRGSQRGALSASPTAPSPYTTPSSAPAPTPSHEHKPSPRESATSRPSTASAPSHLFHLFHLLH